MPDNLNERIYDFLDGKLDIHKAREEGRRQGRIEGQVEAFREAAKSLLSAADPDTPDVYAFAIAMSNEMEARAITSEKHCIIAAEERRK